MDKELLKKAAALCSRAEKCKADIEMKLRQWGAERDTSHEIVDYLEQENFLDELRYAKSFTSDKVRFSKWGRQKIRHALNQKRIPEEFIYQALEEINENEYKEIIHSELLKKHKTIVHFPVEKQIMKLSQFGVSRGYEYEYISNYTATLRK